MTCTNGWGHAWLYLSSDPLWGTKDWVCTKCGKKEWS